ncbi:superoxide dismutase [Marininema halotolerans]|uniref:superoxide dismutase n=1 Tax=Marininema halotolerans TaxID=1155944 RepID=A0A1I6TTY5_9BACL|nr:superoxide dismutase [Marininema halotolerans]SFS92709.1 Superoxide dismutase [Marininema halotolerans]
MSEANIERLRREIQRFAQQGQHLIHRSLNETNESNYPLFKEASEEGYHLIDQLIQMEEESHTDSWGTLKELAQQTWEIRSKTETWLKSIPPNRSDKKSTTPQFEEPTFQNEANEEDASSQTESYPCSPPVPIGQHQLPPLPYPYDALEPYIDTKTMHLHHDQHHLSYVKGLNQAELALLQARQSNNFEFIQYWEGQLAFHGAGHYLHTLFWETMSPHGGGQPSGRLAEAINQYFGSFQAFKKQFTSAAAKVEGSGWAILVWAPRASHLEILQAEKHQNLSQWDVIPLLPLDVWEHAYYLKYTNQRQSYIDSWWNVVNWPAVEQRLEVACRVAWRPF